MELEHAALATAVHPHGRGEHEKRQQAPGADDGSSPRAWGTHSYPSPKAFLARFIPTGVGNTAPGTARCSFRPVHPHGRGEHTKSRALNPPCSGSSPRAWGTLAHPAITAAPIRFIPTGVGNTRSAPSARPVLAVHPHGRGEHRRLSVSRTVANGSSPRAWGTRVLDARCCASLRFIPTGVGNTGPKRVTAALLPVHPHGRGEHAASAPVSDCPDGSSPRAWGTPDNEGIHTDITRFIPTGVGNTLPSSP